MSANSANAAKFTILLQVALQHEETGVEPTTVTNNSEYHYKAQRLMESLRANNAVLLGDKTVEGLHDAMLGTTDGDHISPDSEIPAGEMFRLAAEYFFGTQIWDSALNDNKTKPTRPKRNLR